MTNSEIQALKSALHWHIDAGADAAYSDEPRSMLGSPAETPQLAESLSVKSSSLLQIADRPEPAPLGSSEARAESLRLAMAAQTLDDLREAIAGFNGIGLRETATNLVFADGNPTASVMLVGEAPGGDEDRLGKPFVGVSGQLLDRILKTAGLDRQNEDPNRSVYISNVINWRPPGNRTPTPAEIEVSLPFIERHIQLIKPKILILAGGVAAKALLGSADSISKLRGRWINYTPQTPELRNDATGIDLLATYHPAYLLRTPAQKGLVWADMLMLMEKHKQAGL